MSWREQALEKLAAEKKTAKYDRYADIMKNQVCSVFPQISSPRPWSRAGPSRSA